MVKISTIVVTLIVSLSYCVHAQPQYSPAGDTVAYTAIDSQGLTFYIGPDDGASCTLDLWIGCPAEGHVNHPNACLGSLIANLADSIEPIVTGRVEISTWIPDLPDDYKVWNPESVSFNRNASYLEFYGTNGSQWVDGIRVTCDSIEVFYEDFEWWTIGVAPLFFGPDGYTRSPGADIAAAIDLFSSKAGIFECIHCAIVEVGPNEFYEGPPWGIIPPSPETVYYADSISPSNGWLPTISNPALLTTIDGNGYTTTAAVIPWTIAYFNTPLAEQTLTICGTGKVTVQAVSATSFNNLIINKELGGGCLTGFWTQTIVSVKIRANTSILVDQLKLE